LSKKKPHKRRLKNLENPPFGVDLEEVYGMKVDNNIGTKLNTMRE